MEKGTDPIFISPYNGPKYIKGTEGAAMGLLYKILIRPSVSSWGSPIFLVQKKDGFIDTCISYW